MPLRPHLRRALALGMGLLFLAGCGTNSAPPVPTPAVVSLAVTPSQAIKHVVVIFGENVSFDHYFATYPNAANPTGEPAFNPLPGTPAVNGLAGALLTANGNSTNPANGVNASNPFRLDRYDAMTASQSHAYTAEQNAFDQGAMDLFPISTGTAGGVPPGSPAPTGTKGLVMGYFDGNTVTGMWNLAQHFALDDNAYGTNFGPSTPGAINLSSGQTNGAVSANGTGSIVDDGNGGQTVIGDSDPTGDVCSSTTAATLSMTGKNIGDLLNAAGLSWGWFQGGFNLQATNTNPATGAVTTGCNRASNSPFTAITGVKDYVPHHNAFQYYATTSNLAHVRPTSTAMIGKQGDAANHQYDIDDFYAAVSSGNFPAVSFLKAPAIEDAHPGNSDPLDEQSFVATVLNFLQQQPGWQNTVVILNYDDSDGWYDHVASPMVSSSFTASDTLSGAGKCGAGNGAVGLTAPVVQGRCGFGPRIPIMVISPWAKPNFVDHTQADQSSIARFIEDTFLGSARIGGGSADANAGVLTNMLDFSKGVPQNAAPVYLDPNTGLIIP